MGGGRGGAGEESDLNVTVSSHSVSTDLLSGSFWFPIKTAGKILMKMKIPRSNTDARSPVMGVLSSLALPGVPSICKELSTVATIEPVVSLMGWQPTSRVRADQPRLFVGEIFSVDQRRGGRPR